MAVSAVVFDLGAVPCLGALRERCFVVGAVGNMQAASEEVVRPHVDFVASSERWGVEKPAHAFFERVADAAGRPPAQVAYVGDRVDNDVLGAENAGMFAVHLRRGPWSRLHDGSGADAQIDSLAELPALLA